MEKINNLSRGILILMLAIANIISLLGTGNIHSSLIGIDIGILFIWGLENIQEAFKKA